MGCEVRGEQTKGQAEPDRGARSREPATRRLVRVPSANGDPSVAALWAPGGRGVTDRLRGQRLCKEEREGRGRRRAPWRGMVSLAAGHPARPDGTRDTLGTPGKRHSTPCHRKAWVPSPAPPPHGTTPRASRWKETPAASAEVRRAQCWRVDGNRSSPRTGGPNTLPNRKRRSSGCEGQRRFLFNFKLTEELKE